MSHFVKVSLFLLLLCANVHGATWYGVLRDDKGLPLPQSTVAVRRNRQIVRTTRTDQDGKFSFADLIEGSYSVSVGPDGRNAVVQVDVPAGDRLDLSLQLTESDHLVPHSEQPTEAGTAQR